MAGSVGPGDGAGDELLGAELGPKEGTPEGGVLAYFIDLDLPFLAYFINLDFFDFNGLDPAHGTLDKKAIVAKQQHARLVHRKTFMTFRP